jgi:asparagine synthetase B (glutamine-hydrolysing)
MCGIAGEVCFTGNADVAAVERLKIIDLSASGGQPMVDPQGLDAYASRFFDRGDAEIKEAVESDLAVYHDASREYAAARFATDGADEPLDRALRLDTEVMLVDDPVKRVDNMTMAWGLEARVPFLDHELVELAAACPPELKLAKGGKGVLKDAARGVVPLWVGGRPPGAGVQSSRGFLCPAVQHAHDVAPSGAAPGG